MPNLDHKTSVEYWAQYSDQTIYRVLTFLESVEDWTLDGDPALEEQLSNLGTQLDDIEKIEIDNLKHEDTFISLVSSIKSSRGLRLLQALDSVHPGSASRVIVHAEENSFSDTHTASVFLKRNIAFERLRHLSRIFSSARLQMIAKALEGDE